MPPADRPLRIALFTYSTQARGGVAHTIELGGALHDLGHDVVLHGLDDSGAGFFRKPRCPSRAIAVAAEVQRGGQGANARDRDDLHAFVVRRIAGYVDALDMPGEPYDIYHAHDGISGNALATLVERGRIAGFVRTVHHADDFANPRLARLQERSITAASSVLAVSDLWQRTVRERFGVAASRVRNGVDAERFRPPSHDERARARHDFGLSDGPVLLAIGGIEARKNTLAILEAFALVRATHPTARLAIAGGSSVFDHSAYRAAFDARRTALGLGLGLERRDVEARSPSEAAIVELGVVSDDAMPVLIGAADALVFPSLVEGFGLVVLEALACGVPVVTSAIPPFTEYLTQREAVLVDPNDPQQIAAGMREAIHADASSQRAIAARALVERYSWAASARGHIGRYEECIDARDAVHGTLAR